MSKALELIADERRRQIERKGYTIEHDRAHGPVILQQAARCYASGRRDGLWPWEPAAFKRKGILRNLVRAGALFQAAIDVCEANPGYADYLRSQLGETAARLDAILDEAREMLRTKDGTDGAATCHHDDTFEGVCLRCKEHVGAEPEMEQWRIIQRLHAEDGTQ